MKILKSKKALSPVVASIILIAVTVAVSIAVAAWMGALTFTFTTTEELKITSVAWDISKGNFTVTTRNTGPATLSVTAFYIDDVDYTSAITSPTMPKDITKGSTQDFDVTFTFVSGNKYTIAFLTQSGNKYEYTAQAVP
jgi:flagellin-like protein